MASPESPTLAAARTTSPGEQLPSECVVWTWRSTAGDRAGLEARAVRRDWPKRSVSFDRRRLGLLGHRGRELLLDRHESRIRGHGLGRARDGGRLCGPGGLEAVEDPV